MEPHSELHRPSNTQSNPATVCTAHKPQSLPLIPNLFANSSESNPPAGLENKLAIPKLAAITPATLIFTPNRSVVNGADRSVLTEGQH
ncbi:hypothetical protein F8388_021216 [Cannabis sativa]|uniref:Uncharacterized protein n=1 Tax=Cannabis sativa TaxID=3483 RepID=A0A7J6GFG8_CANSA|nr:hypothetical protein F8388_021216 [Cannabis sativa]